MWAQTSLLRRFMDTNVYGTGTVKTWKTCHKISSGYMDNTSVLSWLRTGTRFTRPTPRTKKLFIY